jgi:hypothetical protein
MFARLAILALAILSAGTASAATQTHELVSCSRHRVAYECFGTDGNNPLMSVRRIQELYSAGWRLIDVEVYGDSITYWLERPITPQQ